MGACGYHLTSYCRGECSADRTCGGPPRLLLGREAYIGGFRISHPLKGKKIAVDAACGRAREMPQAISVLLDLAYMGQRGFYLLATAW